MDFTREPIIETVITPKEGSTLAVRSSKGSGQEEYFVDAVEVVSFGTAQFYRSLERPKSFLLPVSDYEILEVRETRLVLKNVGLDRSIKIAGGREAALRTTSRAPQERSEPVQHMASEASEHATIAKTEQPDSAEPKTDVKLDKKRDRRRNYKRKKGRDDLNEDGSVKDEAQASDLDNQQGGQLNGESGEKSLSEGAPLPAVFSSLLPPPSTLISETIARYKDNALFRGAFFIKEQEVAEGHERPLDAPNDDVDAEKPHLSVPHDDEVIELPSMSLDLPAYTPHEMSEEEVERVYQERQALRLGRRGANSDDESDDFPMDRNEGSQTPQETLDEDSPFEKIIPEEEMMKEVSEGFADNLDVDLRENQEDNDAEEAPQNQSHEDSSDKDHHSP